MYLKVLFFFLFSSILFAGNSMTRAVVKGGELQLSFKQPLNTANVKHFVLSNPHRDIYDFYDMRLGHERVPVGLGKSVKIAQNKPDRVRVVITNKKPYAAQGYRLASSHYKYHIPMKKLKPAVPVRDELIVIDAGHGGHDTGAMAGGKKEKDIVLQIAKKVSSKLKAKGYKVYMTRTSDRFLKLSERTKIADKREANAFISIHANSVAKKNRDKMHGVETFFLQNTRDARSQRIAARENTAVLKGTDRVSKNVIIDSVLNGPKIVESNKLAIDVQKRIIGNLRNKYSGVKDGGVRHAPFYVLVGASRPSILIEVGYLSHYKERRRIVNSHYQNLLAKGIAEGVEAYLENRKKEIEL